jgi:hypothetical protein
MNLTLLLSPSPARRRLVLNLLGMTILLSGLGSATFIWCEQDQIERQARAAVTSQLGSGGMTPTLSPEESRRYTHDVEMYYGKTGLLIDKWGRWWDELTHGKPLATTIGIGSLVAGGGLLYAGAARRSGQRR